MAVDDPRAKGSISTLARDATKGGFDLQIDGPRAREAQGIALALIERLSLFSRLDDWMRLTLRDGDSFLELGATERGEIVEITRKPTLEMVRSSDEFDRFADPMRAFYWTDQPWSNLPGPNAIWFAEWQIVHARWDRDEGSRYGAPVFSSARKSYKRMTQGELDIAIRRKTRAGQRWWHIMKDGNQAAMDAYMVRNKPALDDPFAAVADFFSYGDLDIKNFEGDSRLDAIGDILHHADTFAIASPVPLELIGYGREINRDVLEQKKEQYDESLGSVRTWLADEIVRPLIERQWLLSGIWPDGLDWTIQWKSKKQPTPVGLAELSRGLGALKAAGLVTDELLLRLLAAYLPDVDVDAELAALEARQDQYDAMAADLAGENDGENQ